VEDDFIDEFEHDRNELEAAINTVGVPVDPEDIGHAEAFSFVPDEDRTGTLDSLGGWYTCNGDRPTLSVSLKTAYLVHRCVGPHE
jgi:hypothetical protein